MIKLSALTTLWGLPKEPEQDLLSVCTDSRAITPGCLFVALEGENFDGHRFVQEAENQGARAALVKKKIAGVSIPQLVVADPLQALGELAKHHRPIMQGRVIALTGSNGKTSVKEMIAAILPSPSLATQGNLNNHIGVPLMLMQLKSEQRYAVFELGANHPGEIAYTVGLVQPQVALINNIGPAHIAGFGSIEGVAKAKGEIYQGLDAKGTAVVNEDDAFAHFWDSILAGKKVLRFSLQKPVDFYATDIRLQTQGQSEFILHTPGGEAPVKLQVPGEHNISNALAAAACCYAAGISLADIVKGLESFRGVAGRLTHLSGRGSSVIIDDTYNANLRSVTMALEVLAKKPGRRIFVFGDMGELGDETVAHHREVGLKARDLGIDKLYACGTHSRHSVEAFGPAGQFYSSKESLVQALLPELGENTVVLVKGSRASAMEKIVHELVKEVEQV